MSNKKEGTAFENEFADILSDKGFWCHLFAQNSAGQPADVIAVRNGQAYLIDCKVCERKVFRLSRIEENQEQSMKLWESLGNNECWFALELGREIYMISLATLLEARKEGMKSLTESQVRLIGFSLAEWFERV